MFENIMKFFKKLNKKEEKQVTNSKEAAKERLHLVLMQDRANVSADFLELMKQEIIEVIKKYIDVDESAIDVRLTNKGNEDGTNGAPALYANIPILNIKNEARKIEKQNKTEKQEKVNKEENNSSTKKDKNEDKEGKEKEGKDQKEEIIIDDSSIAKKEETKNLQEEKDENVDAKKEEQATEQNTKKEEQIDKKDVKQKEQPKKQKVKSKN